MSDRWFLRLDGIPGGSDDDRHRGQIDVDSWSLGVTSTGSTGTGAGAGRPAFDAVQISAALSIATPKVFLAAATGRHLRDALLSGVHPGENQRDFLTVKLTDVTVTRSRLGSDPDTAAAEQFSLTYARIEVSYFPMMPTGAAGAAVTAGFDVTHATVL